MLGDQLVVASETFHHHTVAAERAERLGDTFHRRIQEGHGASEHEVTLVAGRIHRLDRHPAPVTKSIVGLNLSRLPDEVSNRDTGQVHIY